MYFISASYLVLPYETFSYYGLLSVRDLQSLSVNLSVECTKYYDNPLKVGNFAAMMILLNEAQCGTV